MIDRKAAHARVDEILNDHLPSMMGRNGVDISLKEFVDQVIDQAYLTGIADEREKPSLGPVLPPRVRGENLQPGDYPSASVRRRAVETIDTTI